MAAPLLELRFSDSIASMLEVLLAFLPVADELESLVLEVVEELDVALALLLEVLAALVLVADAVPSSLAIPIGNSTPIANTCPAPKRAMMPPLCRRCNQAKQ